MKNCERFYYLVNFFLLDFVQGRIKTVFEIFHTLKRFDAEEASDVLIGNVSFISYHIMEYYYNIGF